MQQALEPIGKKQTMSPSKSLLHESSISPLVYRSRPSVSSTLSQQHSPVSSATSEYSGEFVSLPIVQQHMSVSSPASEYSGDTVSTPIVQQHTSVSSPASEYSGDTVSPPIVQKHTYLSTPTSQRCESPKNTKTHWMKEIIAFKQVQNDALTKRLDKLEEREGEMLRVQQQLVVKLE
ncbi:mucin-1-like [Acyrthosiphon pisum]|uniref:Uncharacterized protein n=1 Tax=Acyrthosiphon pisum TaxID=7029 RepID=A0A8R1W6X4_ACYPI|nr:mucin-1-like [Acyrthosiphon pisum]XP_016663896.1 mucin-1-like [Acyrthosiphon pisum]|eukprot:XP_003247873.1 PREDICTED: mucin-1-like [Acyrthosiphon pisum]